MLKAGAKLVVEIYWTRIDVLKASSVCRLVLSGGSAFQSYSVLGMSGILMAFILQYGILHSVVVIFIQKRFVMSISTYLN
jgi:hypothetical protein